MSAKPKGGVRSAEWHNRVLILRSFGYSLKVIGIVAGLHHATVIHHLKGDCRCLSRARWSPDPALKAIARSPRWAA